MNCTAARASIAWPTGSSDTLYNRVVAAGLRLARQAACSEALRGELRQAERAWEDRCAPVALDGGMLARVARERTRLTAAYEPAHSLVTLLWSGAGMPDELDALPAGATPIPGFLWNMATLFERFVARFLREHLPSRAGTIESQAHLASLYRVSKGPGTQRAPKPRPDLMLVRDGHVAMVLDTKYVDLGTKGLADGILYQLSVYGMAFGASDSAGSAPVVALYPAGAEASEDTVIDLCPPGRAPIALHARAVDWVEASRATREVGRRHAAAVAERWIRMG